MTAIKDAHELQNIYMSTIAVNDSEYLKPIKRAVILNSKSPGVVHREEVAILAKLISNMDRLCCQHNCDFS